MKTLIIPANLIVVVFITAILAGQSGDMPESRPATTEPSGEEAARTLPETICIATVTSVAETRADNTRKGRPVKSYDIGLRVELMISGPAQQQIDAEYVQVQKGYLADTYEGPRKGWRIMAYLMNDVAGLRHKYQFWEEHFPPERGFIRLPGFDADTAVAAAIVQALSSKDDDVQEGGMTAWGGLYNHLAEQKREIPLKDALLGVFRALSERSKGLRFESGSGVEGWHAVHVEAWLWRFSLDDPMVVREFLDFKRSRKAEPMPKWLLANFGGALTGLKDLDVIAEMLQQTEPQLRTGAAEALERLGSVKGVPLLGQALYDSEPEVAYHAVRGLWKILHDSDASASGLPDAMVAIPEFLKAPAKYVKPWQAWWEKQGKAKYTSKSATQPTSGAGNGM